MTKLEMRRHVREQAAILLRIMDLEALLGEEVYEANMHDEALMAYAERCQGEIADKILECKIT